MKKLVILFFLITISLSNTYSQRKRVLTERALQDMSKRIAQRHDSLLQSISIRKKKGLPRPKIGYALSGGGAKGLAHIGAIEVLEEIGFTPDYIVGTSMGSIVGALYSVGYPAKQIHQLADSMNWNVLLFDKMERSDFTLEEKDQAEAYLLEFGFEKFKLQLPKGIITGQKLGVLLSRLLWPSHKIRNFSELKIPFKAVATDVFTGERVVLDSGFLPDAVRASMSIPTAFEPMEIDGRMLVDGGVVQNFPVEEVKQMGADIVIGIDVGAILYKRDQLNSAIAIMDQLTSLQVVSQTLKQEENCNVYIRPKLNGLSAGDFDKAEELIKYGKLETQHQQVFLKQLQDSIQKYYPRKTEKEFLPKLKRLHVSKISYTGLSRVSEELVSNRLGIKPDQWTSVSELERGITRLYGTQFFDKVDYQIEGDGKKVNIVIRVQESAYAKIRFGLHYDNVFKAAVLFNYTLRNWRTQGSRLMFQARLSENPGAKLSYRFFVAEELGMSVNLETEYQTYEFPNFVRTNDGLLREFQVYSDFNTKIDLEKNLTNNWRHGFGLHMNLGNAKIHSVEKYSLEDAFIGAHSFLLRDTYDRAFFPKRGMRLWASLHYNHLADSRSHADLANDFWSGQIGADFVQELCHNWHFRYNINFATQSHHNTTQRNQFSLGARSIFEGRVLPFAGVYFGDNNSPSLATAQFKARYAPFPDKFVYATANFASFGSNASQVLQTDNTLWGFAVGTGFQSIIGPIWVDASKSTVYRDLVWRVNVGFVF